MPSDTMAQRAYDQIMQRLMQRYGTEVVAEGLLTEGRPGTRAWLPSDIQEAAEDDAAMAAGMAAAVSGGKWVSAGGVVMDKKDGVWGCYVCQPKGGYGGYAWTLPKGRVDEGETMEETAIREVLEETGMKAKIYRSTKLGLFQGTMSVTVYFLMLHVSGIPKINDEVSKIDWLPLAEAQTRFSQTGNKRDASVIAKAIPLVNAWK
jgi:8-oxo-dGTP pyrophosphatase MutT (NUDIX family)